MPETTLALLAGAAGAGADIIELGVPFSDPMADGPAIQASSQRALKRGMTLTKVLDIVRRFRKADAETPMVLMGYYNPIHAYGTARFAKDAAAAGVDGLITVDLPPEEDDVLRAPAYAHGLDIVRLATPTTDDTRLETVLDGASGFLYYVSIAGVTGTKTFARRRCARRGCAHEGARRPSRRRRLRHQDARTGRRHRAACRWRGGRLGHRDDLPKVAAAGRSRTALVKDDARIFAIPGRIRACGTALIRARVEP